MQMGKKNVSILLPVLFSVFLTSRETHEKSSSEGSIDLSAQQL